MGKRVRLKDIAEAAKVSVMSVSHVLNGTGGGRVSVSAEKARYIVDIANQLNYVPNYAARALRGSSIRVIGVLSYGAMDPVAVRAISCLQEEAAGHGYHVMSTSIHNKAEPWGEAVKAMLSHGINALIAVCDSLEEITQAIVLGQKEGVPVIPLRLDGGRLDGHGIQVDTQAGIQMAIDQLEQCGVQRIKIYSTERERVWRKCAKCFEASSRSIAISESTLSQSDLSAGLIQKGEGVLCSTDYLAAQIMRPAARLVAGEDYHIIGWGNAHACEYMNPRLSSIGLDLPRVMGLALKSFIEGGDASLMQVQPLLIHRESHRTK